MEPTKDLHLITHLGGGGALYNTLMAVKDLPSDQYEVDLKYFQNNASIRVMPALTAERMIEDRRFISTFAALKEGVNAAKQMQYRRSREAV